MHSMLLQALHCFELVCLNAEVGTAADVCIEPLLLPIFFLIFIIILKHVESFFIIVIIIIIIIIIIMIMIMSGCSESYPWSEETLASPLHTTLCIQPVVLLSCDVLCCFWMLLALDEKSQCATRHHFSCCNLRTSKISSKRSRMHACSFGIPMPVGFSAMKTMQVKKVLWFPCRSFQIFPESVTITDRKVEVGQRSRKCGQSDY